MRWYCTCIHCSARRPSIAYSRLLTNTVSDAVLVVRVVPLHLTMKSTRSSQEVNSPDGPMNGTCKPAEPGWCSPTWNSLSKLKLADRGKRGVYEGNGNGSLRLFRELPSPRQYEILIIIWETIRLYGSCGLEIDTPARLRGDLLFTWWLSWPSYWLSVGAWSTDRVQSGRPIG